MDEKISLNSSSPISSRRKFYESIPAGRRKSLKLLDINSEGIEQLLPWSDFIKEHGTGKI